MTDPRPSNPTRDDAVAWAVRVGDPAFDDWAAFEAWLSASPAHAGAYHAVVAAEGAMVEVLRSRPPEPARIAASRRIRWAGWSGGAVAAALVAVLGYQQLSAPSTPMRMFETAAGTTRVVALGDGSKVTLNGATRIAVAGNDPRSVRLDHGEVLFTVRHREDAPFRVQVGPATLVDLGTVFGVVRNDETTRVAVSEGAVEWRADGGAVRVDAGHSLIARDGADALELGDVVPGSVGSWSRGELVFDGQPLGVAVADLSRSLGIRVGVAPALATRPVRATLRLDGGREAVVRRFGALLDLRVRQEGGGWRLSGTP